MARLTKSQTEAANTAARSMKLLRNADYARTEINPFRSSDLELKAELEREVLDNLWSAQDAFEHLLSELGITIPE